MEGSTSSMIITLKSGDGEEFTVPEAVAVQSQMIRIMIEDRCAQDTIALNVSSKILAKVIDFCKQQVTIASSAVSVKEKNEWESMFLDVDQKTLFDLILAANYLNVRALLDLACQRLADMIKGKSPEEIHEFFKSRER